MLLTHLALFSFLGGAGQVQAGLNATIIVTAVPRGQGAWRRDITRPIDAGENLTLGFDFGPILAPGVTLNSAPDLTCVVYRYSPGTDPSPASRILSTGRLVSSNFNGAASCQVNVLIGQMLGGVIYQLQCFAPTSDGQLLDLWCRLLCISP